MPSSKGRIKEGGRETLEARLGVNRLRPGALFQHPVVNPKTPWPRGINMGNQVARPAVTKEDEMGER
jgi:hypothetical protein